MSNNPLFWLVLVLKVCSWPLDAQSPINRWILICCICHFQVVPSSLLIFASCVCKFLQYLISALSWRGKGDHLFRVTCSFVLWRATHCRQTLPGCVGSAHSEWTTWGLLQPKLVCVSQVHITQAPRSSARTLSWEGPCFRALPRPKPLRHIFLDVPWAHRPRWAVCLMHLSGPSSLFSWVCCKGLVSCVPCVSLG